MRPLFLPALLCGCFELVVVTLKFLSCSCWSLVLNRIAFSLSIIRITQMSITQMCMMTTPNSGSVRTRFVTMQRDPVTRSLCGASNTTASRLHHGATRRPQIDPGAAAMGLCACNRQSRASSAASWASMASMSSPLPPPPPPSPLLPLLPAARVQGAMRRRASAANSAGPRGSRRPPLLRGLGRSALHT